MHIRSVSAPSGRWKVKARPRTAAEGAVSGASGTPPALEKRSSSVEGVDCRCGAVVSAAPPGAGVKLPSYSAPLAWLIRKPG